jgi:hypothetical protein
MFAATRASVVNRPSLPGGLRLLLGFVCIVLIPACNPFGQRSAVRLISQITAAGTPAYERETDLELAEQAMAANVKAVEALLETEPRNPTLLLQATQGFAGYTYAFVEGRIDAARGRDPQQVAQQTRRAQQLYQRGMQYGLRLLSQHEARWLQATALDATTLATLTRQLDRTAVPGLFWTSFCWGGMLNMDRAALATATALPRLRVVLQRLLELDETYFYGFSHLLQAVQYAGLSPLLGGNPVQAQHHFVRAQVLSQGRLLIVPLVEAQYYAVQTQDRALFQQRLQHVLDAPETLFPEQGLLNAVAKQRAEILLQRIEELFL